MVNTYAINTERPYYVYAHYKADTGEVFYIGKGKGDRAWSNGRPEQWHRVVNKHGLLVKIISVFFSDLDACSFERQLISLIGREDKDMGPLINHTNGGEGTAGRITSAASNKKCSESNKLAWIEGRNTGMTGKTHTTEWKENLAANNSKRLLGKSWEELYGEEKAAEMRRKSAEYAKNNPHFPEDMIPWNKGKTLEELHGEEKAAEMRKTRSENYTGEKNNRYGTKHSEATILKMKASAKLREERKKAKNE